MHFSGNQVQLGANFISVISMSSLFTGLLSQCAMPVEDIVCLSKLDTQSFTPPNKFLELFNLISTFHMFSLPYYMVLWNISPKH